MNTANMLNFDGYDTNVVVYRHGHWNYRRRDEVAVKVRVCLLLPFVESGYFRSKQFHGDKRTKGAIININFLMLLTTFLPIYGTV